MVNGMDCIVDINQLSVKILKKKKEKAEKDADAKKDGSKSSLELIAGLKSVLKNNAD